MGIDIFYPMQRKLNILDMCDAAAGCLQRQSRAEYGFPGNNFSKSTSQAFFFWNRIRQEDGEAKLNIMA